MRLGDVAPIAFGLVRFRTALIEVCAAGFIGQFEEPEIRRSAFRLLVCGSRLMVTGQVAVRAVAMSDLRLLTVIAAGWLVSCGVGVTANRISPVFDSRLDGCSVR